MKKYILLGIIVGWALLNVPKIFAATTTSTSQPTESDLLYSDNCDHCLWDSPTRLNDGQSKTFQSDSPLIGKVIDPLTQYWNGLVKPSNNYNMLDFTSYGNDVFNASQKDLMPAAIQAQIIPDTSPKEFCVTGRQCVINPETGQLVLDKVTDTVWCTGDQPGKTQETSGLRALGGMMTMASFGTDFQLPQEGVKKETPPNCGQQLFPGTNIAPTSLSFTEQNKYTNAISQFIFTIESQTVQTINVTEIVNGVKNTVNHTQYTSVEHTPGYNIMGGHMPYNAQNLCQGPGCTLLSLAPIQYLTDAQKQYIIDHTGGVWNTYRPDAYDPNYNTKRDAIVKNQSFDVGVGGNGPTLADSEQFADQVVYKSDTYGLCTITSAGDALWIKLGCDKLDWRRTSPTPSITPVPPNPPGIRNAQDAVEPRTPSPTKKNAQCPNPNYSVGGGWSSSSVASAIQNAADTAGIPACVLQGVTAIEWDDSPAQGSCEPNQCAAAGPFQISVGVDSCGKTTCDNCGAGWTGRACNDETWALKAAGAPVGNAIIPYASSACDPNISALAAAYVIIGKAKYFGYDLTTNGSKFDANNTAQQQAIITGTDAYYGAPMSITRLGGLSYGRYVYKTCFGSSYQPPTQPDAFPTPANSAHL